MAFDWYMVVVFLQHPPVVPNVGGIIAEWVYDTGVYNVHGVNTTEMLNINLLHKFTVGI